MARIKGTNLGHTKTFVTEVLGAAEWDRVAALLSKESRATLESVVAVGWYPVEIHAELLRAIAACGGDAHVRSAGAHDAEYDITVIHRLLFRFANPGWVLEKAMDIWDRFYDQGRWTIERLSDTHAIGTLSGFVADEHVCMYLVGFITRLFELVGAKDVRVRHVACRLKGAEACRFEGEWK